MVTITIKETSSLPALEVSRLCSPTKTQIHIEPIGGPAHLPNIVNSFVNGGFDTIVFDEDAIPTYKAFVLAKAAVRNIKNVKPDLLKGVIYKFKDYEK